MKQLRITLEPTGEQIEINANIVEEIRPRKGSGASGSWVFCKNGKCSEIFQVKESPLNLKKNLEEIMSATSQIRVTPHVKLARGFH